MREYTMRNGELVYGLVVAIDIANFSGFNTLAQSLLQRRLSDVLNLAACKARLNRDVWYRQLRGDGELAVLPTDTDAAWVLAHFTERLIEALVDLRLTRCGEPRLRLRVAMHHGTLTAGDFGPVGSAPIVACRLLDARVARRALHAELTDDLILVISEQLYRDVVETRFHGLAPERFRPMRTSVKGVTYSGYLCAGTPRATA
jgi:class 3 adenylate cyclase